mgnify:FL=1
MAYRNLNGVGRVATKDLRNYRDDMQAWSIINHAKIVHTKLLVKNQILRLDFTYYLNERKLFCKDKSPKRFDVSNRIKLIEDSLCHHLGTDDKFVWEITAIKEAINNKDTERVSATVFSQDFSSS